LLPSFRNESLQRALGDQSSRSKLYAVDTSFRCPPSNRLVRKAENVSGLPHREKFAARIES
jgi:hypothetical protein